jgi:hypothetical protein
MREFSAYIDVSNKGQKLVFQIFMANVEQMVVYFQDASQIIATSIFRVTGFGLAGCFTLRMEASNSYETLGQTHYPIWCKTQNTVI